MSDNFGVLGSSGGILLGTVTVYTCPANRAAKVKIFGIVQGGASSVVTFFVNSITVAVTGAMTSGHYSFTNGGAGLIRAPAATLPAGTSAAETAQPGPPIYYLSAGQTIQYQITGANLLGANVQVVGIEVDLTA